MAIRYQNVADDIRRMITSGAFAAGSKLPVEGELAARYRVGLMTLRRALDVLQDEGLVEKHHGRGNYVRQALQRITYPGTRRSLDLPVSIDAVNVIVQATTVEADDTLAQLMGVSAGTWLAEYTYLCEQDGLPRSLAQVYVTSSYAVDVPATTDSPWGKDVRELLVAAGVEFAATVERVSARFPTPREMEALRITGRTSVLAIERTSTDVNGHVVEAARLVLPGDRAEALFVTAEPQLTTPEASQ